MATISRTGTYRIQENENWFFLYHGPLFVRRFSKAAWTLDEVKAWRDGYRKGFMAGARA